MKNIPQIKAVGLMSGTSLDGLDIALCSFEKIKGSWQYKLLESKTISYSKEWSAVLSKAHLKTAQELAKIHIDYGSYLGKQVNIFFDEKAIPIAEIDLVASHGHTVFHEPSKGVTMQIGSGAGLQAELDVEVICDFRVQDVALKGQGAPLVPIGDKLLFSNFDFCLNLGGFANVSFQNNGERIAYDICPVNIVLNKLASKLGYPYDKGGELAASGKVNMVLFEELNQIKFYKLLPPKSLGREWLETTFFPVLENTLDVSVQDKLATVCEHIAFYIGKGLKGKGKTLVTGGGAYNDFLISRLKNYTNQNIILPNKPLIDFKEAIVFAFLGVLRKYNQINVLKSVTGASKNSCSGIIFPKQG